jgi:cation diffusion facilitator CzcD-associated flavoprotein CzcO
MVFEKNSNKKVIVVGAGFSGMACAIKLLEAGYSNVTVYEKNANVGGTWETNKYPGLTCDVPAMSYTYSFERSPEFSRQYPAWQEIRAYCRNVSAKYNLNSYIQFNKEVAEADFLDNKWHIKTTDGESDIADVVIMATGVLRNLNYPDIPGMADFAGDMVHTGKWDESLNLKSKRVGVIGNGATCTQLVPAIIDEVANLELFQRTAHWVAPFMGGNPDVSESQRQALRDDPQRMQDTANRMLNSIEKMVDGILVDTTGQTTANLKQQCMDRLGEIKDPDLRAKLTPGYKPGCKRFIWSETFYPAMQKDNARLVTEGIESIEAKGIRTADGKLHEMDVLILATGYRMHDYMRPMKIRGEAGVLLDDVWDDGEFALRGVAIPEFPNMFMIMGPNSPLTNFSVIEVAEWQIGYFMPLIEQILSGEFLSVQASAEATKTFNDKLIASMPDTIWASGCNSYYLDKNGNPNVWPDTVASYRESMKVADMTEFVVRWEDKKSKAS